MYVNLVQQAGSIDKGKCEKGVTWKNGSFCVKEVFFFNSWSHKNLVGERSRGSCPQSELSNRPLLQLIIKIVCLKKERQALRAENGKNEKEKK